MIAVDVTAAAPTLADEEVVGRVLAGNPADFEILMRRYNQRLYRTARAITRDDTEATDVVQEAYVRTYTNLAQFAGRASFATWLTRIVVHEALARLRRRARFVDSEETMPLLPSNAPGPEEQASNRELARALEYAIDALPTDYRAVFMLREVEGLSTADTAACLELNEATTKTRLHRARALLRDHLASRAAEALPGTFEFAGARCDALVARVLARITASNS
jgi:RNA polymerase sigma-70 factor (ECF subfamily)